MGKENFFANYISSQNSKLYLLNINEKGLLVLYFNVRSATKDFHSFKTVSSIKLFCQENLLFQWLRKYSSLFQTPGLPEGRNFLQEKISAKEKIAQFICANLALIRTPKFRKYIFQHNQSQE